ncbi:MAG TPA: hypothetical protein PKE66_00895 [Pyrinomonadaceae bacterium]|nr:hypothetical protein [Pyrinomonadaceae bacterium]
MNVKSDLIPNFRRSLLIVAMLVSALAAGAHAQTPGKADEAKAKAELKKLLDLRARLEQIPFNGEEREPHKSFIKRNDKKITYNEPAGRWIVRSEMFWELRDKYAGLKIADEIAWTAAQNPIAGECEGYMNCGVYLGQITAVKYLGYFPAGKHAEAALDELRSMFSSYADASQADTSYTPPEDAADRAELQRMLKEIDAVLEKVPAASAAEVRGYIKTIAERYK